MPAWCTWQGDTLSLQLHVQPRARRDEIAGLHDQRLKIRITAPPADDRANRHLLEFLAREFDVPRTQVELLSGQRGRDKRVAVHAPRRRPEWLERFGGETAPRE